MTNLWMDIKHADVVIVMGGNAAEAHPCGFKWVVEAKAINNARLIVVDPRFTRTASVADLYCPIRPGTDIAFLNGVTKYLLDNDKIQHEYVKAYTNAGFVVREEFDFKDGLFTGYDEQERDYDRSSWDYEIGSDGYAVVDETIQHPRCVMQLLRKHVEPYTPEMVERICGSPKADVPEGLRNDRDHSGAGADDDVALCAGLDAPQQRVAEHSRHVHRADVAGQHRDAWWRHERAARSLQYSGTDRSWSHEQPSAGLS